MFKAQMLLFTNRQDDACAVVEHAFTMARQRLEQQQTTPLPHRTDQEEKLTETHNTAQLWNFGWLGLPDGTTKGSKGSMKGTLPDKLTMFERRLYPSVLNNWLICRAIRDGENMTDLYIQQALDLIQQAQQDVRGETGDKQAVVVPVYVMER